MWGQQSFTPAYMGVVLFVKTAEIPPPEHIAQLVAAAHIEFPQNVADVCFDRISGDVQFFGNLVVGISQTNQGGDLLLPF